MLGAWIITLTALVGGGAWLHFTYERTAMEQGSPPRVTLALTPSRKAAPKSPSSDAMVAIPAAKPTPRSPRAPSRPKRAAAGLHPHPDPDLVEKTDLGALPVVSKDGRSAWRVYARPFSELDKRPRIAIVVSRLGISSVNTKRAVEELPGPVTFSFAPFAKKLAEWIDLSRKRGHEVMLDLPLEPTDFPRNDPGPHTLLAGVPTDQNLRQLDWILSRATGYVGLSTYMGSGFATKPRSLTPILSELKARGLMLLDTRENPLGLVAKIAREIGLPVAVNNHFLDSEPAREAIEKRLAELETRARKRGSAVGVAHAYPVSLQTLTPWLASLAGKGIALTPVSAAVRQRSKPQL